MTRVHDGVLCFWLVLTGLAFWGPYLGLPLPDLSALYGLFLVASVAALGLRALRAWEARGREVAGG